MGCILIVVWPKVCIELLHRLCLLYAVEVRLQYDLCCYGINLSFLFAAFNASFGQLL
jgi:hypothetical protein